VATKWAWHWSWKHKKQLDMGHESIFNYSPKKKSIKLRILKTISVSQIALFN